MVPVNNVPPLATAWRGFHGYADAVSPGNTVTIDPWDDGQNSDLVAGDGVIQDPGGVAVPNASNDDDDDDKLWQGGCFLKMIGGGATP